MLYIEVTTSIFSRNCDLKVQKSPFTAETKQMCFILFMWCWSAYCFLLKKRNQFSFRVLADSLVAQGGSGKGGSQKKLVCHLYWKAFSVQHCTGEIKKKKWNLACNMVQGRMCPQGASTPGYRVPSPSSDRCPAEKLQALNLTIVSCVNEDSWCSLRYTGERP